MRWLPPMLLLLSSCAGDPLGSLLDGGADAIREHGVERMPPVLVTWTQDSGPLGECRDVGDDTVVQIHAGRILAVSDNPEDAFRRVLLEALSRCAL